MAIFILNNTSFEIWPHLTSSLFIFKCSPSLSPQSQEPDILDFIILFPKGHALPCIRAWPMLSPLPGKDFFFTDVLKGPPLSVYSMPRAEPSAGDTGVIKETTSHFLEALS